MENKEEPGRSVVMPKSPGFAKEGREAKTLQLLSSYSSSAMGLVLRLLCPQYATDFISL
jgi:hypothetical protein